MQQLRYVTSLQFATDLSITASRNVAKDRVIRRTNERRDIFLLYLQVVLLLGLTFVLGQVGLSVVRFAFIFGCMWVGYQAWRCGPARHLEISIILYIWAPFLRRVVDCYVGFDSSGFMLIGPVLGLLWPSLELYGWLVKDRCRDFAIGRPFFLMGACLLYGLSLSIVHGDIIPAILALAKFLPPLGYGLWLMAQGNEEPNVTEGAVRGFLIAMPLASIYGIYQYFYIPDWDAYWMKMTMAILQSQGLPEAEQVRVFGTMNSAASFGHFAVAALLLIGFVRRSWWSLLLCLPIAIALMLALYRTAWVALAVGFVYCWLHSVMRRRANLLAIFMIAGIAVILATSSFGDVVLDRFSTFMAPANDGSGQARLGQYSVILADADRLMVGLGIGGLGPFGDMEPHYQPIPADGADGGIVEDVLIFGWVVGSIYLLAQVWAVGQSVINMSLTANAHLIAARAIVMGNAVILPLTGLTTGEIGFLFLAFIGITTSMSARPVLRSAAISVPCPRSRAT